MSRITPKDFFILDYTPTKRHLLAILLALLLLEVRVGIERCLKRLPASIPDLHEYFNIDSKGPQAVSDTTRHLIRVNQVGG